MISVFLSPIQTPNFFNAKSYSVARGSTGAIIPTITDVQIDLATWTNICPGNGVNGNESDNWPVTWAENGHQYTTWGDGNGLHSGSDTLNQVSWGFGRIEGDLNDFSGYNVNGGKDAENPSTLPAGKSKGVLAVGNVLYMWKSGTGSEALGYTEEVLYKSVDLGVTWTTPGPAWYQAGNKGFSNLTFVQYGQGYTNLPGHAAGYVYSLGFDEKQGDWNVQEPGHVTLLRVPVDQIDVIGSYEWFAGLDGVVPTWTSDYSQRQPVIDSGDDGMMRLSCAYSPTLKKYILIAQQADRFSPNFKIGWYQANKPWGPWTRFKFVDPSDPTDFCTNAGGANPASLATGSKTVFWGISQKWSWLTPAGNDFVMVFTGVGQDQFGVVQGEFFV